jgi:hypothetical protein
LRSTTCGRKPPLLPYRIDSFVEPPHTQWPRFRDAAASVRLFSGNIRGDRQYDVARDGRFVINTVLDGAVAPITLIQNWNPEAMK